jgi:hypothetical protein
MKFLAIPTLLAVALTSGEKPQTLNEALAEVTGEVEIVETAEPDPEPEPQPVAKSWKLPGASPNEARALEFLQERGINDRSALATVMGNIRQESMFLTDICEGGARVPYHQCHSGGFGLIQWTTIGRYQGLGDFSRKYDLDPTSIDAQLRWMVNEREWILYEPYLKGEGQSVEYYMRHAYKWLGWGIKGARSQYAYDYYNKMVLN